MSKKIAKNDPFLDPQKGPKNDPFLDPKNGPKTAQIDQGYYKGSIYCRTI